jgi:hypothetical protein
MYGFVEEKKNYDTSIIHGHSGTSVDLYLGRVWLCRHYETTLNNIHQKQFQLTVGFLRIENNQILLKLNVGTAEKKLFAKGGHRQGFRQKTMSQTSQTKAMIVEAKARN